MQKAARLLSLVALAAVSGCTRPAAVFSEPNASVHVGMLAGTIGSRPAGTPEARRARDYVIDQLRMFGYEVRVQDADARRAEHGLTARVSNVIAVLPGERREAIGLLSHYDSSPEAPGAGDDAFGVAISLEAARVLAAQRRQWTTFVLVTDAEEAGLMGAAALMTDREVTDRVKAYINLEANGASTPVMLFETGPLNHWIVRPWARRAPHPRGGSFALEVYRRLPNDTDFSILKRHEIPGLNFALVGDSYAYHTARDTAERLSRDALRQTGENVVSIVEAMQQTDITQRSDRDATYFDVAGVRALAFGAGWNWIVSLSAVLFGLLAWLRLTRFVVAQDGAGRWVFGLFWSVIGVAATVAAMAAATFLLRAAQAAYHPWYARPDRLFLLLVSVGSGAAWAMARLGRWLPSRARGLRHPAVVWSYTLPVWIALAVLGSWFAPAAAYLWTLPLFIAGLLLTVAPARQAIGVRVASVIVLAVAGSFWLRDALELMRFAVAVLGRLPIVTPAYLFAVLIGLAGLMIVPPFIAAVASERPLVRPAIVTVVCLVAIAIAAPLAFLAPAYTAEQPLRRELRAFQDVDGPASIWVVGGNEPGPDVADTAPGEWVPGRIDRPSSIPRAALRHPFVFSGTLPPLGPAPAAVLASTAREVPGGTELSLTVVPQQPGLSVAFVLPAGVTPTRSSLPGVVRSGRWTAVYIAPPAEGLTFHASFTGVPVETLRQAHVAATSARLPGGQGWQSLPAWLPQERTVWTARATWVLPVDWARIEPVPPLR